MDGLTVSSSMERAVRLGLLLTLLTLLAASVAFQAPSDNPMLPALVIATLLLQTLTLLRFMCLDR